MIRVGAGTQHKKEKKQPKIPLECFILRPKFLECICLEKNTKVLSSRHSVHVKENERNGQDYQKYALFVPFSSFSLSLSLFCSLLLRFLCVRILSLSPFVLRLCLCLCARGCLERPDLRVSEFRFHFNRTFSSRALTY